MLCRNGNNYDGCCAGGVAEPCQSSCDDDDNNNNNNNNNTNNDNNNNNIEVLYSAITRTKSANASRLTIAINI